MPAGAISPGPPAGPVAALATFEPLPELLRCPLSFEPLWAPRLGDDGRVVGRSCAPGNAFPCHLLARLVAAWEGAPAGARAAALPRALALHGRCPLSEAPLDDPVTWADGHTYSAAALAAYRRGPSGGRSPVTCAPIAAGLEPRPNHAVAACLQRWPAAPAAPCAPPSRRASSGALRPAGSGASHVSDALRPAGSDSSGASLQPAVSGASGGSGGMRPAGSGASDSGGGSEAEGALWGAFAPLGAGRHGLGGARSGSGGTPPPPPPAAPAFTPLPPPAEAPWAGHSGSISALTVGWSRIATGGVDCHVRVWSAVGTQLARLGGHQGTVNCLAFVGSDARLASGASDGRVFVWDVDTDAPPRQLATFAPAGPQPARVRDLQVEGTWLVCGSSLGEVRGIDLPSGRTSWQQQLYRPVAPAADPRQQATALTCLHVHDGLVYCGGGTANKVKVRRLANGAHERVYREHTAPVVSIAVRQGLVVSGDHAGRVVGRGRDGGLAFSLQLGAAPVYGLCFAGQQLFAALGYDLWSLGMPPAVQMQRMHALTDGITALGAGRNFLYLGSRAGHVVRWPLG